MYRLMVFRAGTWAKVGSLKVDWVRIGDTQTSLWAGSILCTFSEHWVSVIPVWEEEADRCRTLVWF